MSIRLQLNRLDKARYLKWSASKAPSKFPGTTRPSVYVEGHWQVGNRRRLPFNAFVNQVIVNKPTNLARPPFYRESMKVLRCIKAEVDIAWSAPIAVVISRPFATRIKKDID